MNDSDNTDHFEGNPIYFSFLGSEYSRSGVYLTSEVLDKANFCLVPAGFRLAIKFLKSTNRKSNFLRKNIVVLSPSHLLVIYLAIFLRKRVILDAGWPLTDSTPTGGTHLHRIGKTIQAYLIDFASFALAKKILLESQQQKDYVSKHFLVRLKKIEVLYTGVNENQFRNMLSNSTKVRDKNLQVLFRGKYNPESGLEVIAKASVILEGSPITFTIITNDKLPNLEFSKNVETRKGFLSSIELQEEYQKADICLGQFSVLDRLERTIPHKFYEAMFFGKIYLSPRNEALEEIIPPGNSKLLLQSNSPSELALALTQIAADRHLIEEIGSENRNYYDDNFSQEILSRRFLSLCKCD